MLLLLFLFSLPSHALSSNQCANSCRIETRDSGERYAACGCDKKSNPWANRDAAVLFNSRLAGATEEERKAILGQECRGRDARLDPTNAEALLPLATRPFCECVRVRSFFPLTKNCETSKAGEKICTLAHGKKAAKAPLREPWLIDYQACVIARLNYKRPETCADAKCTVEKRACPSGRELVNVADPGACCPVFVCDLPKTN